MASEDSLEIRDTSGLLDADWAAINQARAAYKAGGADALHEFLQQVEKADFIQYARIIGAFFPDEFREAIKDQMAAMGMDEDDLRAMIRKLESPARDQ